MFGLLRGRYLAPAFAVKIGESAIRKCFRDQLDAIRKEGLEYMGEHPCIFTEIGIPYDMDDRYAYRTGDFSSQSSAMDANHFALEASGANGFALWLYMCTVSPDEVNSMSDNRIDTNMETCGTAKICLSTPWMIAPCLNRRIPCCLMSRLLLP